MVFAMGQTCKTRGPLRNSIFEEGRYIFGQYSHNLVADRHRMIFCFDNGILCRNHEMFLE